MKRKYRYKMTGESESVINTMPEYAHDYLLTSASEGSDVKIALKLAAALSAYRMPGGIAAQQNGAQQNGYTDYAEDFDELPVTDEPGDIVRRRMESCRAMILICSPETKNNKAISDRLKYFEKSGRRDAIIPVLVRGESRSSIPDFFYETRITEHILKDGSIEKITGSVSPVASDLRGADNAEEKRMLAYETVRIVAALTGLHPDELEKRHERRRKQRFTSLALSIGSVSACAAVIFLFLGFTAYNEGIIAERQTERSAQTVSRVLTDLPQKAAEISGAGIIIDEVAIDSLDALAANGSANLKAVDAENILKIKDDDEALIVLKKASLKRRLGEKAAAVTAYEIAQNRSSLLWDNEALYKNAYEYAVSGSAEIAGCIALVLDYDSDVSPIVHGEIITALNGQTFAKYTDYSSALSELIPRAISKATVINTQDGRARTQEITTEQLKLLVCVIL